MTQPLIERNIVTVSLVTTQSQPNKFSTVSHSGQPTLSTVSTVQTTPHSHPQQQQMSNTVPPQVSTTNGPPTSASQATLKQHPSVLPQQASSFQSAQHQSIHLQQRRSDSSPVLIPHQPHLTQPTPLLTSHPSILQSKSTPPKSLTHQMTMHHNATASPILAQVATQAPNVAQLSSHPSAPSAPTQSKPVINSQATAAPIASAQATQSTPSPQAVTTQPQPCLLPHNVHQRPPLQQPQSQPKSSATQSLSISQPPSAPAEMSSLESESSIIKSKEDDAGIDDVASTLKKSTLNPEAKEFVYNPTPKSFTPASVSILVTFIFTLFLIFKKHANVGHVCYTVT